MGHKKHIPFIIFTYFLLFLFSLLATISAGSQSIGNPFVGNPPQNVEDHFVPEPAEYDVEVWIKNLQIPWSLVFISEDKALVTERTGQIRLIKKGQLIEKPYKVIEEVTPIGEGGLMGLVKHPNFKEEKYLYVMYTYVDEGEIFNRVTRYFDTGSTLEFDRIIIDNIPGSNVHNGGRIAFGPDGMLYICTGDTWQSEIAQDKQNLGGKILRLSPEGNIPQDNPFPDSPVYSLGHRNPQGLAWHPETNDLFSSEHGPSGEFGLYGRDIINVIVKGGNYGWPLVLGYANIDPYLDPIIMWLKATPPSGIAFWDNRLFVASLRSKALVRIEIKQSGNTYEVIDIDRLFADDWYSGIYGRLRDAVVGPDNALYILTSNYDGRGKPLEDDDKILRLTIK